MKTCCLLSLVLGSVVEGMRPGLGRRAFGVGSASTLIIPVDTAFASVAEPTASVVSAGVNREIARKILQIERLNVDSNNNGDPAKHLPKIEISGTKLTCSVPHVMDPAKPHYIEYIWLKDENTEAIIAAKSFNPTDPSPPTLSAECKKGASIVPHIYCNLHGLWIGDTAFV